MYIFGDERIESKFWDKVFQNPETSCWEWTGGREGPGYGNLYQPGSKGRVKLKSHRYFYSKLVCEISSQQFLDHICHNRVCVNPTHLRVVTNKQNSENRRIATSSSGYRNVYWNKEHNAWKVSLRSNYKNIHGGYYKDLEEAIKAAKALRAKYFTHSDSEISVKGKSDV